MIKRPSGYADVKNSNNNNNNKDNQALAGNRDRIRHRKMCHANNEKRKKRLVTDEREQPYPDRIRKLKEKKNFHVLGDIGIRYDQSLELKEKLKKNISDEQENFSWPSNVAEISLKGCPPL